MAMPEHDPREETELRNQALLERSRLKLSHLLEKDPELRELAPSPDLVAQLKTCATTIETVAKAFEVYAERPCLSDAAAGTLRYRDVWKRVEAFASGLAHENLVGPGDLVGICGFGSIDWVVADYAALHRAAVSAPFQTNLNRADLVQVIRGGSLVCLVCSADQLDAIEAVLPQCPSVRSLVLMDAREGDRKSASAAGGPRVTTMKEVEAGGREKGIVPKVLPSERGEVDPLMTLIYTSGSTGAPKGAMYPESLYRRMWQEGRLGGASSMPELPYVTVIYMPLNHGAGRWELMTTIARGGLASFVAKSDMSTLFDDIRLARPTHLFLVPRVSSTIHQHYLQQTARGAAGVMEEMRRSFLGDRLLVVSVGTAPTAPEVVAFLQQCFEVPVIDVFGSTEAGLLTTDHRVNTEMGVAWKLVDVPELGYRTTDRPYPRGELHVKTPLTVPGYYENEAATRALFDDEGFVNTGDVAEQRGPDRLYWLDRAKNVLKLSQGEFVATTRLEGLFVSRSPFIRQMFIYGNGFHSFLLAVVVPDLETAGDDAGLKNRLRTDIDRIAREAELRGYEVPRDFLIERTPFSVERKLLTASNKQSRPALQARYGKELDALYARIEGARLEELYSLQREGAGASTSEKVRKAIGVTLGLADLDVAHVEQSFIQLGGDSLSAVGLATLVEDLTGVRVPVGLLLDPTCSVRAAVEYVDNALAGRVARGVTFAEVHGAGAASVRAEDVRIEKFLGSDEIAAAREAKPAPEVPAHAQVALLTGANGFLGRFLAIELLERLTGKHRKLYAMVRAPNDAAAHERFMSVYDSDPALAKRIHELSACERLVILAGDLIKPRFGLASDVYARLEAEVDLVVHAGALVNHALGYEQLFEPNVLGTLEVLRFALRTRQKTVSYVSTIGVVSGVDATRRIREDQDLRTLVPELPTQSGYAAGYNGTKWASELLLRDAHAKLGVPLLVFRPSEIMAHSGYHGQVNLPDFFTRLLAGVVYTGLAPESFYAAQDPTRHFDGLPVDVVARCIAAPSVERRADCETYHVVNPHYGDGISLDVIVDWVESAGYPVKRIPEYEAWYRTFEERLKALREPMRQHSPLAILGAWEHPETFGREVDDAHLLANLRAISPRLAELPHVSEPLIHRMLDDMVELHVIESPH